MNSADLHAEIAGSWPSILSRLGIDEQFLKNRHGPCPACGGRDRYRFDNRHEHGDFYCNQCGSGDGFKLLMLANGWTFREAFHEVRAILGHDFGAEPRTIAQPRKPAPETPSSPSRRVRDLIAESARLDLVPDACAYLESRGLTVPSVPDLRGVARAAYWHDKSKIGTYPAMLGLVRDVAGELVTGHITYLENGRKLELGEDRPARKILSPMRHRSGCSIRLGEPVDGTLGIAEGIETALAASQLLSIPVWAALNASVLAHWTPPESVQHVVICYDRDDAGEQAANELLERLQSDGITCSIRPPRGGVNDWADAVQPPEPLPARREDGI